MGARAMRILAKLHIWLGWLIAVPLLLWTVSGLVMVVKPIEEVRGQHLLKNPDKRPIPPGWLAAQLIEGEDRPVELRTRMQGNSAVTSAIYADGAIERYFSKSGEPVPAIDLATARTIVAMEVTGGDQIVSARFFEADKTPMDFRRSIPVWQVELEDGTHVYVGRDSGEIEAIRTRWWRTFDTMWGLHIMDLQTREDTSHPVLIAFAALGIVMSLIGTVLLFRRRKANVRAKPAVASTTES